MTFPGSDDTRARLGLALLLATAAALLFVSLGTEGLTDPDESAYAESVREMAQRGDWLVPRLYDQPFLDSSILFRWSLGASFRILGASEFAARLPSALAALALLLAVYRLARLIHGTRRAALVASCSLAASLEFVLLGRAAVTDMILTLFCTLGILCYLETLHDPARRLLPLAGAACIALAVLTRGPEGMILPGLVLGSHLLATRSLHRIRDLRPVGSFLAFSAVAVPWYATLVMLRPGLVKQFLVPGDPGRFLKPEHHSGPPAYYLVVLAIGFVPWAAFLPGAVGRALVEWRRGTEGHQRRLLPALWLLVLLLYFTLSAGKLPSTILPAFPAAALLVAGALEPWLDRGSAGQRLPGTGAMIFLVLFAAGMLLFTWKTGGPGSSFPLGLKVALLPVCLAALLGSLLALGALLGGYSRISYFLLLGGNGILIFTLLVFGFPQIETWRSSREPATVLAGLARPNDGVVLFHENHPGIAFYMRRIPELMQDEEALVRRLESVSKVYCLMARERYEKLRIHRPGLPLHLLWSGGNTALVTNLSPESPP